jgi:hypothetical protein
VTLLRSLLVLTLALIFATPARADDAADAVAHANSGLGLVAAGNCSQALVEFQAAYEKVPNPDYIFNMAQCEYQLGDLKPALEHYQEYIKSGKGKPDAVHMARMRIDVINRRESVIAINTEPLGADVLIEGNDRKLTGQAPNRFSVPRGHYDVTVSKPGYESRKVKLDVDVASAQPLFFNLRPTPGRLEIRTFPPNATLYVRGNRAQNPYVQSVEPGQYEIYAEATDYSPRREVVEVKAGERKVVPFELPYVQRSGRPELITFFTAAGAVAGGAMITALLADARNTDDIPIQTGASASLLLGGALAGGVIGALAATSLPLVPDYIPDNRALFRIGAMAVGAVEGAAIGAVAVQGHNTLVPTLAGAAGLVGGFVVGATLDEHAPNYGRVAVIQSGAAIGALIGALTVPAIKPEKACGPGSGSPCYNLNYLQRYEPVGILVGLNVGLAAGLALAYLPDQRQYGPRWQRVALIDLAAAAGGFIGAASTAINRCIVDSHAPQDSAPESCRFTSAQPTARAAIIGGVLGLTAGWILTGKMDRNASGRSDRLSLSLLPQPTALVTTDRTGATTVVPALGLQGRY